MALFPPMEEPPREASADLRITFSPPCSLNPSGPWVICLGHTCELIVYTVFARNSNKSPSSEPCLIEKLSVRRGPEDWASEGIQNASLVSQKCLQNKPTLKKTLKKKNKPKLKPKFFPAVTHQYKPDLALRPRLIPLCHMAAPGASVTLRPALVHPGALGCPG